MGWLNVVVILYALLNIGGGIAGYVEKHSMPSIISGTVAGVILIGAAALATTHPKAQYITALVALADLGFFVKKFMEAQKIWPAGVMMAASVIVLICLVVAHFSNRPTA